MLGDSLGGLNLNVLWEPNECFKAVCPFTSECHRDSKVPFSSCCPVATIKRVTTRRRAEIIIGGRNFQRGEIFYHCLLHLFLNVQVQFLNVFDTFASFSFYFKEDKGQIVVARNIKKLSRNCSSIYYILTSKMIEACFSPAEAHLHFL